MDSTPPFGCTHPAFGSPGMEPHWTRSAKDAVGTAYAASSRLWFTLAQGIVTEVYYPTVDQPQIRDLQLLVTDGKTFFHEERKHMVSTTTALDSEALAFGVVNTDPRGRYRLSKEILSDPHQACLLLATEFTPLVNSADDPRLFVLCAPHMVVGGWHNNLSVMTIAGRSLLVGYKQDVWMVLGADVPFLRCSSGYVGASDGWTDLAQNFQMDWQFDCACDGNVAGIGELPLGCRRFTLGLAFGPSLHSAANTLLQALDVPFAQTRGRYIEQWRRTAQHRLDLSPQSCDGGELYRRSVNLLLTHEDKTYPGAMIASLSIPWGEVKGDDDLGGYHLVWTRDMVKSAIGLLAAGHTETPLRALIYLATSQRSDGGFYQNFWIDGRPYWAGEQLDESAFPILLAWRLQRMGVLRGFDPYPMVLRAAGFLIGFGPVTPQERWEECSGYSPSTLAALIAGLACAAAFARERNDAPTAEFIQSYADFLNAHVEEWTVTHAGTLVPGMRRHYIRILPARPGEMDGLGPDQAMLRLANRRPGSQDEFPAREIVDAGFLELVRYGIRRAGDPLMEDSLRVADAVLKVATPYGNCWRRYNHDGYGQRDDGGAYIGWGRGRAWPLLAGERAHYELAAGRPVESYVRALEGFSHGIGLLPEQIWDAADLPARFLFLGRPTGSAMPLMWVHSEYIQLLRSRRDGQAFSFRPEIAERYASGRCPAAPEFWSFRAPLPQLRAGGTLLISAAAPFRLHWSADEWRTVQDTPSTASKVGLHFLRLPTAPAQRAPLRFTFFWPEEDRWEGRDFQVALTS